MTTLAPLNGDRVSAAGVRHVGIGRLEDLAGVRRFMVRVLWVLLPILVLVNVTPGARLCFRYLLNAKGELLDTAVSAFLPCGGILPGHQLEA